MIRNVHYSCVIDQFSIPSLSYSETQGGRFYLKELGPELSCHEVTMLPTALLCKYHLISMIHLMIIESLKSAL